MERQTKAYFVVPTFDTDMERVQFMSVYKTNVFPVKDKETGEHKVYELQRDVNKRRIRCTMKLVSKSLLDDYNQ